MQLTKSESLIRRFDLEADLAIAFNENRFRVKKKKNSLK